MQIVLFTKLFETRSVPEIAEVANDLGFDGIDLLVRPGATIEPSQAGKELPAAVAAFKDAGLGVPMATTGITSAEDAGDVLTACADAGINLVRLGYWPYKGDRRYAELVDEARRDLAELEQLARSIGIRLALQVHGGTIHASGVMAGALLADRDPAYVSAYADPGNQAVQDGREDWRLTFDVLEPWLSCVGVKNGGWAPGAVDKTGQRRWTGSFGPLAAGMVPWPDIIDHLSTSGFDGLLSLHSHYRLPFAQVIDETRTDVRHVRRLLDRAGAAE